VDAAWSVGLRDAPCFAYSAREHASGLLHRVQSKMFAPVSSSHHLRASLLCTTFSVTVCCRPLPLSHLNALTAGIEQFPGVMGHLSTEVAEFKDVRSCSV
jgi:hypothetical protein